MHLEDIGGPATNSNSPQHNLTRRSFLQGTATAALGAALVQAGEPTAAAEVREVRLPGFKLLLSAPRVVAERDSGHCWYPDLLKFSTGELMLNHSLNDDSSDNQHNSQAVYISTDGGRTFPFAYDVNGFHNGGGEPRLSLPDGRIVGTSTFLKPDPLGQWKEFKAHRWTYDRGGRRYAVEPWGARVTGLPRAVRPYPQPNRTWWAGINWFSDIIPVENGLWLSTISLRFEGDRRESTVAVHSHDEGRTWQYVSMIAGTDSVADAIEGFDEPCLVRLEGGDILCVSRVGSTEDQKLARTYSSDGGKTWSKIDRLPAYSVAPQIARLTNGVLALGTGRPGVFLWFATDPRSTHWQSFNVLEFHNQHVEPRLRYALPFDKEGTKHQSTSYTALVEVSENHLFFVYDRSPFGWNPVPPKSGERTQIFLLEARIEPVS